MVYSYYPGCTLKNKAQDLDKYARMSAEALGFTLEEIQSCHMPIGTAIKAVTPAEIAISIAGELIMERAAT